MADIGYRWADLYDACLESNDFSSENQVRQRDMLIAKNQVLREQQNVTTVVQTKKKSKKKRKAKAKTKAKPKVNYNSEAMILEELAMEMQLERNKELSKLLDSKKFIESLVDRMDYENDNLAEGDSVMTWTCSQKLSMTLSFAKVIRLVSILN